MSTRVCWLASYPKSGNTWVRFLLHQYFFGLAASSADVHAAIPGIHAGAHAADHARPVGERILVKTHFPYTESMPLAERTGLFVCIVRHPRDVIRSALDYTLLSAPPGAESMIDAAAYVRRFIELGGDPVYHKFGFGAIGAHVSSWLDEAPAPGILIRYEDLRKDAAGALGRMVRHLGFKPDPERVRGAVEASTFERMRELEVGEKRRGVRSAVFAGTAARASEGRTFMNRGVTGRSLDEIEPGLDAAVEQRFADVIERCGLH